MNCKSQLTINQHVMSWHFGKSTRRSSEFEIATIILAAGSSSRLPVHKALLEMDGRKAIRQVAETALLSKSDRCLVVLGAKSDLIRAEINDLPVEIVENYTFAQGRTGSIKCALKSLGETFSKKAVLIFPVDCPFVSHRLLDKLIDCFHEERQRCESLWIVPSFSGKRGHPILLSGSVLPKICDLDDDFPLREYLHAIKGDELHLVEIPVESKTVLDNMNTKDEVLQVCKREGLKCLALPS